MQQLHMAFSPHTSLFSRKLVPSLLGNCTVIPGLLGIKAVLIRLVLLVRGDPPFPWVTLQGLCLPCYMRDWHKVSSLSIFVGRYFLSLGVWMPAEESKHLGYMTISLEKLLDKASNSLSLSWTSIMHPLLHLGLLVYGLALMECTVCHTLCINM